MVDIAQRQAGVNRRAHDRMADSAGMHDKSRERTKTTRFRANVVEQYQRATGITPRIYVFKCRRRS